MDNKEVLDSLEDMVRQFAYEAKKNGRPAYWTGGLSALETAFVILGWDDPQPCPENQCEIIGCREWANCGTPLSGKSGDTNSTYVRCCGKHMGDIGAGIKLRPRKQSLIPPPKTEIKEPASI